MYRCHTGAVICKCIRINQSFFQTLRSLHRNCNHYETLNLKPHCTAKEIRDSFIKLSKENHPDVSSSDNTTQNAIKFRNILEAYRVLGRPDSRAMYDSGINHEQGPIHRPAQAYEANPNVTAPYYGIFGSKKISNKKVALYCVLFMVVGAIIQALAIRYSLIFRRAKLDKISMDAGKLHSESRANAMEFGNDKQIQKLIDLKGKN